MAWVPTATISFGAGLVGEEHRDVLAGAVDHELLVRHAPLEQVLAPGRAPVEVHVVDQLGAAAQRAVGDRVEVADDDVGLEADLEQRVGAAVDADQHRLVLAQVRLQRREVAAVVVAAHDDERVPALDLGAERRQQDRLEGQLRFTLDVLERVLGELLELDADVPACRLHGGFDRRPSSTVPVTDELAVAPHLAADDPQLVALGDQLQDLGPDVVDERDPRLDDPDRPAVRVPAGDRDPAVDHRDRALRSGPRRRRGRCRCG